MFATHCATLGSVLHVPQTIAVRSVLFVCACMNASEVSRSSENGRHVRNGSVCVILRKNVSQPAVVKFCPKSESNGCGKGVGSTGGDVGITGSVVEEGGREELEEGADVVDAVEGRAMVDWDGKEMMLDEPAPDPEPESCGARLLGLCRSCVRQSNSDSAHARHVSAVQSGEKMSRTAGCARVRVESVMRIRTAGTSRIDQRVRRALRRFFASAWVAVECGGGAGIVLGVCACAGLLDRELEDDGAGELERETARWESAS